MHDEHKKWSAVADVRQHLMRLEHMFDYLHEKEMVTKQDEYITHLHQLTAILEEGIDANAKRRQT